MRFLRQLREEHRAHREERRFAHGPHEGGPHEGGRGERFGRGGRLARFLEHGDLRLLVLHLIAEKPRHGYEIIKAIEDLAGGAYAPSPGVVYPTLTLLEDIGQISAEADGARKIFSVTDEGRKALAENQTVVETLLARIASSPSHERSLPIMRAVENLRTVLKLKLGATERKAEVIRQIVNVLDETVRRIEEL
jgi:DNA-binding PadR family transcriptional regulator